jgi:hypothetical protein
MPKRLLDDSYLSSPSLARCSPRAQDAFPRFILLADDFGCFEAFPRVLVAKGWPYRTDVSEADVWGWLEEYVAAGMACLWTEKERRWCYLTGWHGPHGQKVRAEYNPNAPKGTPGRHGSKRRTPVPPADLVAAVMAGARRDHDGKPPGVDREGESENPGDFLPAREIEVSRQSPAVVPATSRVFPGPAVPVAVPVPVAGNTPAEEDLPGLPGRLVSPLVAFLRETYPDILDPWACEEAWRKAYPRVDLLAEALAARAWEVSNPKNAKKDHARFLNGWFSRSKPLPPRATHGDLGSEIHPWPTRLTPEEKRQARAELAALHPDLADAPIGITGDPQTHPVEAIAEINARWRAVVEARA